MISAVRNGHIKRITDEDIQSSVLEIVSANVSTTFVTCPADPAKTLGIKLPFLVMIIKNLKRYFTFEVQVLDDKNVRRRFRASNYQVCSPPYPVCCFYVFRKQSSCPWLVQELPARAWQLGPTTRSQSSVPCVQSTTRVKPFICTMPMRLDDGWNQIQFNLADFTRRAYGVRAMHVAPVSTLPECCT